MHLQSPEQQEMSLKSSSTMKEIFDKSQDMELKLHENQKQT